MKPVIVACDMLTPFGRGVDACYGGIVAGHSMIRPVERFSTAAFMSEKAAIIDGLAYHKGESLVMQMFSSLFADAAIPSDAALVLATTKGEIDLLEAAMLEGREDDSCVLTVLLQKLVGLTGVKGGSMVVSAACASATVAIARAASMIKRGRTDCVVVVACDAVTEFVFSGFSSLMALDKNTARPFDRNREGLSLGEAAGYVILMSEARAKAEGREVMGGIKGWGLSDDANHMTGPSRESEGLIIAIRSALGMCGADDIGMISAHGTGTAYNDAMELRAFRAVFDSARPVYSIKGALGHTMGAAGMLELMIALRALKDGSAPATVNHTEPDELARGWVSTLACPITQGPMALMTNAGFSGINAALVVGP